jgi:hypothetical protein
VRPPSSLPKGEGVSSPTPRTPLVGGFSAAQLPTTWRAKADELARFCAPAAVAFRDAAQELEAAPRADANAVLTLAEAAMASGYSKEHLRHQLASGAIPNAGKKRSPRVRIRDLPTKGARRASTYDPGADALSLVRRASS